MRVGIGLALTNTFQRPFGDSLLRLAQQVEQAGFATLAVADHFAFRSPRQPDMTDWYESWSTLAFVAACTKRIRLSTMVSGITMRNPVALVKTVNTLDAPLQWSRLSECGREVRTLEGMNTGGWASHFPLLASGLPV